MTVARLATILIFALALLQSGCKGCGPTEKSAPTTKEPAAKAPAVAEPAPASAAVTPQAAPVPPKAPERYLGPQSESPAGYKLTSGFANQKGESVRQPTALEQNTVYVTALSPEDRPIGDLDKVAGVDVHGFLVDRDMRQAYYAKGDGPVAEGADARQLKFMPREGGDHAMMVVVSPAGSGEVHTISTPVVIKGALPEVMGPGVSGMSARSRTKGGDVELRSEAPLVVGQPAKLSTVDVDNTGKIKGSHKLPFAVIYNDQMGYGEVLNWDDAGATSWRPTEAGTFLVLAPPEEGDTALAFKLVVAAPKPAEAAK